MIRRAVVKIAAIAALAACTPEPEELSGRALFDQFCVACHGTGGLGDGPAAADLPRKPADLTRISARNGGTFPLVRVMSVIDGYTRTGAAQVMPDFGAALAEGPVEMVDTGNGVMTPTPSRLVALAEYLRTIQQ
jgi:mono/diheme cytochrome c family protein